MSGPPSDPDVVGSPLTREAEDPTRPDARGIHRIPVRLAVSERGVSAPLGVTRDLSLQGLFIETKDPFNVGVVIPLSIELEGGQSTLIIRAEVVRRTDHGMGLRFDPGDRAPARRLRRWIVDKTSVLGHQKQAEQLYEASAHIEPIRNPTRILRLLDEIRDAGPEVTLVPVQRVARDLVKLAQISAEALRFVGVGRSTLAVGEDVYVLTAVDFVSYSFSVRVLSVDGNDVRCALPEMIVYSERRTRVRVAAAPGTVVRWPTPWAVGGQVEMPVVEWTDDGLSFLTPAAGCLLTPGTPLVGATLVVDGAARLLTAPTVRHLTPVDAEDGSKSLRVGVSTGDVLSSAPPRASSDALPAVVLANGWAARSRTVLRYWYYKALGWLTPPSHSAEVHSRRITIPNGDLPLAAILDQTSGDAKSRLTCPLVIVVPGFAGRKEQMSFLSGTLREGFRKHHRDIAVLRFDGSNNLGESARDRGCEADGMQALHYTASGVATDVLAALAWARHNKMIEPTHIIVVSVSMGSIGTRQVLARPDAGDVGLWVSYMGAADAIDAVLHVSGYVDLHGHFVRGEKLGYVSIGGVLNDVDRFWADLKKNDAADLDAAKRDMAKIRAEVLWIQGKYDAWMDPRRVRAMMGVPASAPRHYQEVESGHLPRRGELAVSHFVAITQRVWRHVYGDQLSPFTPSVEKLEVAAEAEWSGVRRAPIADRSGWWRDYLLENDGPGFDVLEYDPGYASLMEQQAALLQPSGRVVLEIGAGTGNFTKRILAAGPARLEVTDLVPEALAAVRGKIANDPRAQLQVVDIEGTPILAMRRWLAGDLPSATALAERVPAVSRPALAQLLALADDDVHAALLGREVDLTAVAHRHRLPHTATHLLGDLNVLARVASGRLTASAAPDLAVLPRSVFDRAGGLPFADQSFDAVGSSLVLSYLAHPEDALFEIWRVLKPGGRLMLSSMLPDSESSKLYLDLLERIANLPEDQLGGVPRNTLIDSARKFVDHGAELFRLEEEGLFHFYDGPALAAAVRRRGFVDVRFERAFGHPPQAVVLVCHKP